MPETFCILLAGGIMFAASISDPRQVTLQWLRLCGILALSMAGLGMFFLARHEGGSPLSTWIVASLFALLILAQLAFAQLAKLWQQEMCAGLAFFAGLSAGEACLRVPDIGAMQIGYAAATGVAVLMGLVLMDMLLGHAYLTAQKMTIAPFRRLNFALGMAMLARGVCIAIAVPWANHYRQVYLLWGQYGLLIITRVLVGLLVPGVFVYMAHDCIKRRSTQSATGILYVAGVLVFIGEIVALYLVRATGLPF